MVRVVGGEPQAMLVLLVITLWCVREVRRHFPRALSSIRIRGSFLCVFEIICFMFWKLRSPVASMVLLGNTLWRWRVGYFLKSVVCMFYYILLLSGIRSVVCPFFTNVCVMNAVFLYTLFFSWSFIVKEYEWFMLSY